MVLLDVAADAYLCLPGVGEAWRTSVMADGEVTCEALCGGLAEAGLLRPMTDAAPRIVPQKPTHTALGAGGPALSWRHRRALAAALWDVAWRYRGRSLAQMLEHVAQNRRGRQLSRDEACVVRLSRAFEHAVVWAPLPAKCLVRSFFLLNFLHRCGFDATWCFGVSTWPFSAHCWLQVGAVALDEFAEHLDGYATIHAV
ncbi:lasso peptide biosynthesis B2 protein [Phenylobacterium sp.]|uniref:lasso peptide biosynthesis B2 protein n=1 Tax=Phenylobacterium sp. TaxID=1871053 RepID=UPI0035AFD5E3